ncbi:MAG TPA: AarF/UbiB family protein, partial [Kofleriaceae bacterium]|nr:AarF/UbiB family protein [Kofleriaceae bacterium]
MVSVVKTVKNTDRLRQIATVLAKHGFGQVLGRLDLRALIPGVEVPPPKKSFAVRLREAAQELGPSFVKLGQIASTRTDLLPLEVITELKKLQEDVPPMTDEQVEEVLQDSFGGLHDELFASFERAALASASIGQVHLATLRPPAPPEGDDLPARDPVDVVVKLQRPRIRGTIERDIDLLYLLARLVERHVPESRVYSPVGLVSEFDRSIMAELDFKQEADNAERFARNFEGDARVRFPAIHKHASGKRVLTMERFEGRKIYDAARDGAGETIAKHALHVIARMIFEHGFFHADPHPGNIIILGPAEAPVIGLIDLGLVGRLSPELRDKAIDLMIAAITGDPSSLADALLAMGRARGRVDMVAFRAEVGVLSEKYLGRPLAEVELSALIRDLVQGAVKYEIDMPVELMMVGKALMTVEGIGKEIYPELDVWTELRPYFLRLVRERYSPQRLGRDLLRAINQLRANAGELPGQINDILNDLRAGRLAVRTADTAVAAAGDRLGRRLFSGI